MENGLLEGMRAISLPARDLQVFNPSDLFVSRSGDFALGTGAGAATMGRYELLGPFCYFEFQAQFGVAPTIGASGFNLVTVRLPVPAVPAPTAELVGGTNSVADLLSGSAVCVGNAHLTTASELKSCEFFPALFQGANGVHPDRQSAIFLPCNKIFSVVGTATVASGTKLTAVTHGHGRAPSLNDVLVTPTSSWQTSGMTQFWISNPLTTTFDLNATVAAAGNLTGNQTFSWSAAIRASFLGSNLFPFDVNAGGQLKGSMLYRWR